MSRLRSVCFFAFVFTICKAQESVSSEDLKSAPAISVEDESKSGAHAESFANSDGGYAKGESYSDANSGSTLVQSSASSGGYGSTSAQASAQSNVGSEQYINPYGLKELNLLGPGLRGSGSTKTKAEAVAQINGINNMYDGLNPGVQFSPYNSGSSSQALAEAHSQTNNGGYYYHNLPSNYNYGSSSSQAEAQALLNAYEISQNNMHLNPSYQGNQYPMNFHSLPDSAQAQAKVQNFANADINNYNPGFDIYMPGKPSGFNPYQIGYPVNVKQNSAQSLAEAQAFLNAGGAGYSQGNNGYQQMSLNPGLSITQAEAQALTDVNNYNSGINPYISATGYPEYLKPSSTQSSAEAQALMNGGGGGYSPGLNTYRPGNVPVSSGSSHAEAQAIANNGPGIYVKNKPYLYPYGLNNAQAQTEAFSGGYGNTGLLPRGQGQSAKASAEAQSELSGQGSAIANAQSLSGAATGYSMLIPSHEYIMPHLISGMERAIVCTSEGEMYNVWSPVYECLVCACVTQASVLTAVCTRCDGCKALILEPIIVPDPTTTEIIPQLEITCSPLPSWQSFENPLNPCQVCICKEVLNNYGVMEAQIDCTVNPDCVLPPDAPLLPTIPDELPTPLPMCEKFPQNVLFPHPIDECKLCKCEEEMTQLGLLEPRIICMTNPDCRPETVTIPEVIPHEDLIVPEPLLPIPVEPIHFPDIIVTPEPLPWPPVTTLSPIGPGPLPGPSPHESCRPFQPGQTFQHPWDECQVCVCTEARDLGLITIEVNCFTKKSCCYEISDEPVTPVSPVIYHTTPSVQVIDKLCEFKTFGVEFSHPQDNCKVCTCEYYGGVVKPSCEPSQKPECLLVYLPGTSSEMSEAQALAISQASVVPSYLPSTYSPLLPKQGLMFKSNAQTGYPSYPGYQSFEPYNMGIPNLQPKEREKLILSPLINEPLNVNKYSGYAKPGLTSYRTQQGYQGNLIYPVNQNSAGSVDNEAMASAYSDVNQPQTGLNLPGFNQYKQILGYPVTGSAMSQAESSLSGFGQQTYYPGHQILDPFWTGNKGQKNILTGYNKLYYPDLVSDQISPSSVRGNAQSSESGSGSFYQGVPVSNIYPTIYSRPSYEIAPLYYPEKFGLEDSSAQALSLVQGLGEKEAEIETHDYV